MSLRRAAASAASRLTSTAIYRLKDFDRFEAKA
jgi:hypothetical protein